ncbi:hypothetical protein JTE90_010698 [Oedothorax gibbosus]|uniref:Uncharacterized protein n=1 Tax=Oedothorax gibbosus TaxID=931172 RepID=A0AAV6TKE6_9ARAC|nr:hypothetical protein JTE90_010698 [Oedothorax gibbosus]
MEEPTSKDQKATSYNAWSTASYPCGNSSHLLHKTLKSKGSIGPAFAVRIILKIKIKRAFSPFFTRVSVLAELPWDICVNFTDVPPQPNNPPETVLGADRALQGQRVGGERILTGALSA